MTPRFLGRFWEFLVATALGATVLAQGSMKDSPLPEGLINTPQDEVLDLMAFLLSPGDPNAKMFH